MIDQYTLVNSYLLGIVDGNGGHLDYDLIRNSIDLDRLTKYMPAETAKFIIEQWFTIEFGEE